MSRLSRTFLLLLLVFGQVGATGCRSATAALGSYSDIEQSSGGQTAATSGGASATLPRGGGVALGGSVGEAGQAAAFSFEAPVAIDSLFVEGKITTDPVIRGDGLELFFMSTRSGNKSIWRTLRDSVTSDWQAPEFVTELNSDAEESNPRISADGLRIWFCTSRDRAVGMIWESTRSRTSEAFAAPTPMVAISGEETSSSVSAAFNAPVTIAIVSTKADETTQGYDLIEWRRDSASDAFSSGVILANVNSDLDDFDPWLSADGTVLVFHSNRAGSDDLFWASRPTTEDDFGVPVALGDVSSTADDAAPSLSSDFSRLVFASTRDGDERLYEAVALE